MRPSWLVERGRLETLQHQIVREWARFADVAEGIITDTQRAAVVAAHTEAHQLTLAALHDARVTTGADVVRLPVAALHDLIGVLGDGSPLRTLLDKLGQQAAQDVGDALTHAVAVGRNPRRTARDIQDALGGNLNRALTIARTEQMRAYRNASLQTYQANSELLRGWRWLASPSRRTCPVCLAMDGTEHPLDAPFASHIRCRCTPVPILRDAPPSARKTGAEWFAEQDEATQREMIGPGKQKLYAEGKLTLADLVGVKDDAQWGRERYQRSLKELGMGELRGNTKADVSGSGDGTGPNKPRNTPNNPLRVPLPSRHNLRKIAKNSQPDSDNTVIEPWVDVAADIAAINAGQAIRKGQDYLVNGRIYREKGNGSCFPVSGNGMHQIDRGTFIALKEYNSHGITDAVERFLTGKKITAEQRAAAQALWKIGQTP